MTIYTRDKIEYTTFNVGIYLVGFTAKAFAFFFTTINKFKILGVMVLGTQLNLILHGILY